MGLFTADNFRLPSAKERLFYQKKLYPLQDDFFCFMGDERFYLSGGTCLSRFYFDHRYSDDLDFFYDGARFPKEDFRPLVRQLVNTASKNFKVEITQDSENFILLQQALAVEKLNHFAKELKRELLCHAKAFS